MGSERRGRTLTKAGLRRTTGCLSGVDGVSQRELPPAGDMPSGAADGLQPLAAGADEFAAHRSFLSSGKLESAAAAVLPREQEATCFGASASG